MVYGRDANQRHQFELPAAGTGVTPPPGDEYEGVGQHCGGAGQQYGAEFG